MEENYVELLLQKYRLAVVLAVLQNKPNNISIEDYLMELKNNIRESESQAISVDEEDFNISDDEINLNTVSLNIDDNSNGSVTILQNFENILDKDDLNLTNLDTETLLHTTNSAASQNNENVILPTQLNIQTNTNLEFGTLDKELKQRMEKNLFKEIEPNQPQLISTNKFDEQASNSCYTQNYTHISQSQDYISVQSNYFNNEKILDMKRKNENELSLLDNKDDSEIQVHVRKKLKPIVYTESITDGNSVHTAETQYETSRENQISYGSKNIETQIDHINSKTIEYLNTVNSSLNNIITLENTTLNPKNINFDCSNEVQIFDNINVVSQNAVTSKVPNSIHIRDMTNSKFNHDFNSFFEESQDILTLASPCVSAKICSSQNELIYLKNKCDSLFDPNLQNVDVKVQNTNLNKINLTGNKLRINDNNPVNALKESKTNKAYEDEVINTNTENLTESQAEIIPFKVMGELNKIKSYLNKNDVGDSHALDSGFKSRSSTASQSTPWLNQSSHCLFTYLAQTPLFDSTVEINYEIAKVLGELIDRLHENEKYPSFLEEMLEFIANLISTIYEGKCDVNVFFNTDESIGRLLLLNKSKNIIKYTIEKIVKILESFHEQLERDTIELTNINKTENLAYIFHLLETLLKKHIKITQFSQNTRFSQSQEDKSLKRSTITEIWRKKWNLTKNEVFQKEEKDILVDCSDVLNKIIVKAMNNYSLIAFAALQCFNLLQS
ncbi:unnamed protein product [Pieris brassicae]|uniref:Uncharacterized protein n=2 Tax=Pieris brassicae TaxID=7116 RepID=A0A9P0XFW1_PIEBR|nr:unnamed protein product [Pieris brassicae]